MKPHLEEAERMLQLADRDIKAFEILKEEDTALLVTDIRRWAEEQVNKATESEQSNGPTDH